VAEAQEELVEGTARVFVGCVVLLYAHIYGSVVLFDFAEYVACEGELGV